MRMLNYATSNSNPFHRDNRSVSSTTIVHTTTKKAPISSFPTVTSRTSSSNVYGNSSTRKDKSHPTSPPEAVFTSSKNDFPTDDSDTYSEMTLSAAFCGSNVTEYDDESRFPSKSEMSSDRPGPAKPLPKHISRFPNAETVKVGKLSGITLQETLNWRRRRSDIDMDGKENQTQWNGPSIQAAAVLQRSAMKSYGPVKKRLAQVKSKMIAEKAESDNSEKVPDFMLARARLKNTKRRGVSTIASRSAKKSQSNHAPSSTSQESAFVEVSSRYKRANDTQIIPSNENELLGFECVRMNSSPTCVPLKATSAVQEHPEVLHRPSQDISIRPSPLATLETQCLTDSLSIEKKSYRSDRASDPSERNDGIKNKLNAMFSRRGQSSDPKRPSLALTMSPVIASAVSSPDPLINQVSVALPSTVCGRDRKEVPSQMDMKAVLNSMLAKRVGESPIQQIRSKTSFSSDANTLGRSSEKEDEIADLSGKLSSTLVARLTPPSFGKPKSNNTTDQEGSQCRDDVDNDERLDSGRDSPLITDRSAEYEKYSKMLKMGLPPGAVKNAMLRDGVDPSTIFKDAEETPERDRVEEKDSKDAFRRTRLHWDIIPVDKFSEDCIWCIINLDSDVGK